MRTGMLTDADLPAEVDVEGELRRLGRAVRRGRTSGVLAAVLGLAALAQLAGPVAAGRLLPQVVTGVAGTALLAAAVLALLTTRWQRRLTALVRPLRATFTVGGLATGGTGDPPPGLAALHLDLAAALDRRMPRLGLTESEPGDPTGRAPHVHVEVVCVVRSAPDGRVRQVDVRPSVRVGPATEPASLAPAVVCAVDGADLSASEYERLLRHLAFSVPGVVSRLVEQRARRAAGHLPTRSLRARMLCAEGGEQARSNPVDGLDRARLLYEQAAATVEGSRRPLPVTGPPRLAASVRARVAGLTWGIRRAAARLAPRLASKDVLLADALLGYADSVLLRRGAAGWAESGSVPVYEAAPVVRAALARLESLPPEVAGRDRAWFAAQVMLARTCHFLGDPGRARLHLARAAAADPRRAAADPSFVLAAGAVEHGGDRRLRTLQRAADLDPASLASGWQAARERERWWRGTGELDATAAAGVLDGYGRVLDRYPDHVAARAAVGHIHWLLAGLDEARSAWAGPVPVALRDPEAAVDLDLGLARVAAETGRFDEAYRHAVAATSALLELGFTHRPDEHPRGYGEEAFAPASPPILERCQRYRERVTARLRDARAGQAFSPAVLDVVNAFVWYDVGECLLCAGRLDEAEQAFRRALQAQPGGLLPRYRLWDVHQRRGDPRRALELADEITSLDASWRPGTLLHAFSAAGVATAAQQTIARCTARIADLEREQALLERGHLDLGRPDDADAGEATPAVAGVLRWHDVWDRGDHAGGSDGPDAPPADVGNGTPGSQHAAPAGGPRRQGAGDDLAVRRAERDRLDSAIARERRSRAEEDRRGRAAAADAVQAARRLVPHGWLWRHGTNGAAFDWSSLNPPDPNAERRWERQLQELHVVALYLHADTLLRFPPEDTGTKLSYQRAANLLRCIHERFMPRNRPVLVDLLLAEAAVGAPRRIASVVDDLAQVGGDEARAVVAGVADASNASHPDWQAAVLTAAAECPRFSPALSAEVADLALARLPLLDRDQAGRVAAAARRGFLRALESTDEADLLMVAEGLSELCDDHAAAAFRRVLAAAGGEGDEAGHRRRRATLRLAALDFLAGRGDMPVTAAGAPGEDGDAIVSRAEIAAAIGEEMARAAQRPCTDTGSVDAGYEGAWLWVAAEKETAARAEEWDAWRDAEAARLELVAAHPPSSLSPARPPAAQAGRAAPRLRLETSPLVLRPEGTPTPERTDGLASGDAITLEVVRGIEERFGVRLPPVEWQETAGGLPPGGYRFVLDEIPVAAHRVEPGAVFVPGYERRRGAPAEEFPVAWDPLTRARTGAWLPVDDVPEDLAFWTASSYLGRHLAAFVRSRLDTFVGVDEVRAWLERWVTADNENRPGERASVWDELGRGPGLRTLTCCLRALLREEVPLTDADALVTSFRAGHRHTPNAATLAEHLRKAIPEQLPGNGTAWERVVLPSDLEDDLSVHLFDAGQAFAVPAPDLSRLLVRLRPYVAAAATSRPVALVTEPSLRPHVRQLTELLDAAVPVLARDEVVARAPGPPSPPLAAPGRPTGWTA